MQARSDDAIKIGLAIGGFILFSRIGKANASNIYPPGTVPNGGTLPGGALLPYTWSRQQITLAQSALNELGFYITVDGILGNETANAIGNYQASKDYADTGILDAITYASLLSDTSYS